MRETDEATRLDDLDELIDTGRAGEDGLADDELGEHAADGPDVDRVAVLGRAEDELGRAVVAAADVGDICLAGHQHFGAAEVAEFEDMRLGVDKQVLRLDVAVAHAERVDVRDRAADLKAVDFDELDGHAGLDTVVVLADPAHTPAPH